MTCVPDAPFCHHSSGQDADARMPDSGFSSAAAHTGGFAAARLPRLGVLQITAIRPRGGQAAAGMKMGMNYGCASFLGEYRTSAAGHLPLQR